MATLWDRVEQLAGQTLRTKTGRPFQVASVDGQYVTVIPERTGTPRSIRRVELEAAYELHLPLPELTATRLVKEKVTVVNPVYLVAIVKAVDGHTEAEITPSSPVAIVPQQVTLEEFVSQLERIAHLHHMGLISRQDFEQAKLKLLKATD